MKRILIPLIVALCIVTTACPKIEQNARDASAALKGLIESAQTEYNTQCQANAHLPVCDAINRSVAGQNALVTSTEAYCGWSQAAPPPNPDTTLCVPVKGTTQALQSATSNANLLITELRTIIQSAPAKGVHP